MIYGYCVFIFYILKNEKLLYKELLNDDDDENPLIIYLIK